VRIVLAQINPTIGDLRGNLALIQQEITYASQEGANVVVFPELATVGYPPRDLLYDEKLWKSHETVIEKIHKFIKSLSRDVTAIVGGLHQVELTHGRFAHYNAAFIIDKKQVKVVHKRLLPCYDVFDETRYFAEALQEPYLPITIDGVECDILICEDIWSFGVERASWMSPHSYDVDPISNLKGSGPIIVLNASPYWHGKLQTTRDLLQSIADKTNRVVFWCNQVGGHDDIIFGGYSMVVSPRSIFNVAFQEYQGTIGMATPFKDARLFVDIGESDEIKVMGGMEMNKNGGQHNPVCKVGRKSTSETIAPEDLEMYFLFSALQLGLRDYCRRTGFKSIVFGASGGIDSAVVGAIAAITLGGDNCTAITMPSPYSTSSSWEDARDLAENCGMHFMRQEITTIYQALKETVLAHGKQKFKNSVSDENLQPRARAILLMAESNEEGSLLLTTGNKSELAVGYCTIYGDMCGGYSLLPDVPKTWVFALARFINKYFGNLIPENTITKPPSAELKPDQKDTDSLPPYDVLDPVLDQFLHHVPMEEIKESTLLQDSEVERIQHLLTISEYKRSQAPIGPKVTERAFGSGQRIPIAKKVTYV
jgi:NAD+ synthase (glutamine-hydrolysing)